MTMYRVPTASVIQEGHVCVHGCRCKFAQIEQRGLAGFGLRQRLQPHQFALGGLRIQAGIQELVHLQGFVDARGSLSFKGPALGGGAGVPIEERKEWKRGVLYELLIYGGRNSRHSISSHVVQKEKNRIPPRIY